MFGDNIPKYKDYLRTNWSRDPFSYMCYTYVAAGSSPQDCDNISKNVDEKLWFAGEHTHFEFIGTVNSAYLSGQKAAEKLIGNYVQNFLFYVVFVMVFGRLLDQINGMRKL